ncbi:MAG: S8 family serine peptidase [Bacteroidales bacterium]|nr:S8 family serine peptidase [Bacteroidales bacterium]
MRKIFFLFIIFLFQNATAQIPSEYRVTFKNKNNTPYSLTSPLDYLSQKAIDRRTKQSIPIDSTDIPITPAYLDSIYQAGAELMTRSKWLNSVIIYTKDTNAINKIKTFPFVESVELVGYSLTLNSQHKKHEPKINETYNSTRGIAADNNYGPSYNQINMLGGDILHDENLRGQNMTIAVLDAGFSGENTLSAFDSINLNHQILGEWTFVENKTNIQKHTHGTWVLSIMGANKPGSIIGTAPLANYYLLVTEDASSEYVVEEDFWVSGAEYADSVGSDIINSSLGYLDFDDSLQNHTYSDLDGKTTVAAKGANFAFSKGMIVVVSAGNDGPGYICTPADANNALTVGAVTSNGNYAFFSSVGPNSAGVIKPNVASQGYNTILADQNDTVSAGNGTSFSSPLISGMTACLWQAFYNLKNSQIVDAIQKSSSQYGNPDKFLGYGIPNFPKAKMILMGIKIESNKDTLIAFPNPFKNELHFIFYSDNTQEAKVDLIELTGRIIYSRNYNFKSNGYYEIDIPNTEILSVGIYYLRVTASQDVYVNKVLKY